MNKLLPPVQGKPAAKPKAGKEKAAAEKSKSAATSKKAGDASAQTPEKPAAPAPIDLTFLDAADVTGTIQIGELKVRQLEAKKVSLAIRAAKGRRSEEHTSELQSLMRISYAVFCSKKKNRQHHTSINNTKPE